MPRFFSVAICFRSYPNFRFIDSTIVVLEYSTDNAVLITLRFLAKGRGGVLSEVADMHRISLSSATDSSQSLFCPLSLLG